MKIPPNGSLSSRTNACIRILVFAALAGSAVAAEVVNERMEALRQACVQGVDSRITGKTAAASMPLFSGLPAKFTAPPTATTYVPNENFWLNDIRSQTTGVHMSAEDWGQAYGLMPITRRHCLSCGHNGPLKGKTVTYVSARGEIFQAKIAAWINDHPGLAQDQLSDRKQPGVHPDLSVYLLDRELPAWVNIAPIFPKLPNDEKAYLRSHDTPAVCISQGDANDLALPPSQQTLNNRMAYLTQFDGLGPEPSALRKPFYHAVYIGDSGTPMYLLVGKNLYLYAIVSGPVVADHLDYINALIARANAAGGLPEGGFTVTEAAWPRL